jgi:hypothetical protein
MKPILIYVAIFWDVAPWILVEVDQRYRGFTGSTIIALMKEAVSTSKTSIISYQINGATNKKIAIFLIVVVRTWSLAI